MVHLRDRLCAALLVLLALLALLASSCQRSAPPPAPAPSPAPPTPTPTPTPTGPALTDTQPPVWLDEAARGDDAVRLELPAHISPSAFCPLYAQVVCRKVFACAEPEAIAADAAQLEFKDEAGCRRSLGRFCGAFVLAGVEASVEQGRVSWDGGRFAACFSQWVGRGCAPPLGDLPATQGCRGASVGLVAPGGLCTSAFDCALVPGQENVCVTDQDQPQGRCRLLGQPGQPCQDSGQCRGDLRCVQSQCRQPGGQGAPCVFDQDCTPGLRCPDATWRCTP